MEWVIFYRKIIISFNYLPNVVSFIKCTLYGAHNPGEMRNLHNVGLFVVCTVFPNIVMLIKPRKCSGQSFNQEARLFQNWRNKHT